MANYQQLKNALVDVIKQNGNNEITGEIMQTTLLSMINSLGANFQFAGILTPSTSFVAPDENVFFIGGGGTYNNFGANQIVVPNGSLGIFMYNGNYTYSVLPSNGVFDISVYRAIGDTPTTYADLAAALGTDGVNVPDGIRKGGMSIKFIQSSDNKYVQYRLMANSFSTNVSDWQGVDETPIAGSQNLVKSGGVSHDINLLEQELSGSYIIQPTAETADNRYILSDGTWVDNVNYSSIIDVSKIIGKHITQVGSFDGSQYAFLKSYNSTNVEFVNGGGRISGALSHTEIPEDAKYLYMYWAQSLTNITTLIIDEGETEGIKADIINLGADIINLEGDVTDFKTKVGVIPFGVELKGNQNSVLTPINDIVLAENGDSIEFDFAEIGPADSASGGYAFSYGVSSEFFRGIAVSINYVSIRTDDGEWIALDLPFDGKSQLKIAYENDVINIYADGEVISTYAGQKTLTIKNIGKGIISSNIAYWTGKINKIKINGVEQHLLLWQTGNDVGFYVVEDKDNNAEMPMYAEKTISALNVYIPTKNGYYIKYPIKYWNAAYVPNTYPSFYDFWGIGNPILCTFVNGVMTEIASLFNNREVDLAISVPSGLDESQNAYVGGAVHGFENIMEDANGRHIVFLIDNQRVSEDGIFELKEINSVEVYLETSFCQAYTNVNPFANVIKRFIFNNNKLVIETSLKAIRSIKFRYSQFAMFGVYRHWLGNNSNPYLTNRMIKNNIPFKVWDVSDGWDSLQENEPLKIADKDCTKITAYGEKNIGFCMEIESEDTKPNGGMFVGTNNASYNKIYFDLTDEYTVSINEVLSAKQIWSILI